MPLSRLAVLGVATAATIGIWAAPATAQEPSGEDFADLLGVMMGADDLSFASADYDPATATATLVDVELGMRVGAGLNVSFGEVVMVVADWAAIQAMLEPPEVIDAAAEPVPLLDSLETTDLRLEGNGAVVTVESSMVTGLRGRPFRLEFDQDAGSWTDSSAADAAMAFGADSSEIVNLRGTEVGTENSFSISSVAAEDIGPGRVGAFRVSGLATADAGPDAVDVTLDLFQVLGIDASALLGAVAQGQDPDALMEQDPIAYGPKVAEIRVEQAAGTMPDGSQAFRIGQFLATIDGGLDSEMMAMSVSLTDLTAALEDNADQLIAMGYDTITLNGSVVGNWQAASTEMDLAIDLTATDMGRIQVETRVSGLHPDMPPPPASMALIKVLDASARFDDDSVVNRAIDAYAADAGLTADEAREQILADMAAQRETAPTPDLASAVDTLMAFVQNPQNLTLTFNPPTPVGPMEIMGLTQMGPGPLADALQPNLVANQ